jgi:hypothetical protein
MVRPLEAGIYAAGSLLSIGAGALTLNALARFPGLGDLKNLSTIHHLGLSSLVGLGVLFAIIVYRWPYKERTMSFRQLKGESVTESRNGC